MKLPDRPLPRRHLHPGELLVTGQPLQVVTVLGSCVAVTMFNTHFQLAAICHATLPRPAGQNGDKSISKSRCCYLSHVVPAMAERFSKLGIQPDEVEVKLFGGGDVIGMGSDSGTNRSIGRANVTTAREMLKARRFQIKAANVGGNRGCKIVFNTQTGEVLHKLLPRGATRS